MVRSTPNSDEELSRVNQSKQQCLSRVLNYLLFLLCNLPSRTTHQGVAGAVRYSDAAIKKKTKEDLNTQSSLMLRR